MPSPSCPIKPLPSALMNANRQVVAAVSGDRGSTLARHRRWISPSRTSFDAP